MGRLRRHICQTACILFLLGSVLAGGVRAETPPGPSADELFQDLLERPDDVELTVRYAEAAAAEGDYETAVSALEREDGR